MDIGFVPLLSTVVSMLFAVTVLDQYFARRKPYQFIWAIGLFMYAISTFAEFWSETWGINVTVYRLWYLFGAIFVAAYLGMGTAYLVTKRRTANRIMVILLIASLYAAFRVVTASIDISGLSTLTGAAMPRNIRLLTPFFNTFGTVFLVGGALYSVWIFRRKKILPHRVKSNILIAFGSLLPALGGSLLRFGQGINLFYYFELVGIMVIFVGFLQSREVFGFYRIPLIHGFAQVLPDKNVDVKQDNS